MSAPRGSRSNTLIAVPLALSFFAIGVALYGGNRGAQVQGPREIAAVSDDALWLVVDDEVLVLDAAGAVKSRFSTDSFGFANSFSTITRMPEGRVLLSVRGIADWPVVEAATGKVLKRIGPGSEEGKRAIDRTYHLAVAPNGDIAMATSGDHSVLLLDAEGRQKARSPDALFRFANSVWHSDEGWWVADTNNHKLRLLDAATLAPKAEIALERGLDPAIWTGLARPHPAGSEERFATLARMQDGMIVGRVVDVDRSGKERVHYRLGDDAEPGALMWWRGHLLVVDSRRFSPAPYPPPRHPPALLGLGQGAQETLLLRQHHAPRRQLRLFRQPAGDPARAHSRLGRVRDLRVHGSVVARLQLPLLGARGAVPSLAGGARAPVQCEQLGLARIALRFRRHDEAGGLGRFAQAVGGGGFAW